VRASSIPPIIGIRASRSEEVATDSMRGGGREAEVAGGVMSRAAGCGVMPLGGDGGVMPSQEDCDAMSLRSDGSVISSSQRELTIPYEK
jgi:hypothetical protein